MALEGDRMLHQAAATVIAFALTLTACTADEPGAQDNRPTERPPLDVFKSEGHKPLYFRPSNDDPPGCA
jgi:hypothetical protein